LLLADDAGCDPGLAEAEATIVRRHRARRQGLNSRGGEPRRYFFGQDTIEEATPA
jgi:hypothetical protein